MRTFIYRIVLCLIAFISSSVMAQDYTLVWADEFNVDGRLDSASWNYERGFCRNNELQWYQSDNAYCQGGHLIIEARKEHRPNPAYRKNSRHWGRAVSISSVPRRL